MRGHGIKFLKFDTTPSAAARMAELERKLSKSGGTMAGDLNMGDNKITNLKFDNNPTSVARIQELSLKLDKIGGTLSGPIDMTAHSILNVNGTPHFDHEVVPKKCVDDTNSNLSTQITNAYKQYVDHSHVSPSGLQRDAFRYLMEDTDDSSRENNIQVTGIVDFAASPHQINKNAYQFSHWSKTQMDQTITDRE